MESPECPVCLQPYDNVSVTPRVLSCGHTTCEPCLACFPQRFPNTIRCPICNYLIKFPSSAGPSSFPKNIDLLRFVGLTPPTPIKDKVPSQVNFSTSPRAWSELFYDTWRKWILSIDDVSITDAGMFFVGREVELFKIGELKVQEKCSNSTKIEYAALILNHLHKMSEKEREELRLLLQITRKTHYHDCLPAIWSNPEDRSLNLVFDKLKSEALHEDGLTSDECFPSFAVNGMNACEAVMSSHFEGSVVGILGVSCLSVDQFGRLSVSMKEVLECGREIYRKLCDEEEDLLSLVAWLMEKEIYVSPELLLQMREYSMNSGKETKNSSYMEMEVWSLGCLLIRVLLGKKFTEEMRQFVHSLLLECTDETVLFRRIIGKIRTHLETELKDEFHVLKETLCRCVEYDSSKRPLVDDVWKIIRSIIFKTPHVLAQLNQPDKCVVLSHLCLPIASKTTQTGSKQRKEDFVSSLLANNVVSNDMRGLLDCVTGLAIGGGFLFSSSYDKQVHVWSLQDYSHVHAFKGHNTKVMAVAYITEEEACVSADGEGGIFLWSTKIPLLNTPLKSWYDKKDWRFSGIHSLAATDSFVYTGSGDRTVKAWSLKDCSLHCTMEGHKSVVSSLVISNGALYSGGWDGKILIWSLCDHTLLTVLEDSIASVFALKQWGNLLVSAHENGLLNVFRNDVLETSVLTQVGSTFALDVHGTFMFSGGRDKAVKVQGICGDELQVKMCSIGSIVEDSVITAVLFWEDKLFIGFGNRTLKVYYGES